jgi:hypothetical protein
MIFGSGMRQFLVLAEENAMLNRYCLATAGLDCCEE